MEISDSIASDKEEFTENELINILNKAMTCNILISRPLIYHHTMQAASYFFIIALLLYYSIDIT